MVDSNFMFVTGRLVQGDVFEPQTKNMTGGPLTDLKGNPKVQYFIGVAVPKTDQAMLAEYAKMQAVAQACFPGGESQRADFAWKVVDGDLPQNAQKEGFPGCFIFRFTSGFAVRAYTAGGAAQIVNPAEIKRGYFVRVTFTAKANGNQQKPGLYLNTAFVELIGYGAEIASGPDAAAVLAGVGAAVLPAGASATPVAGGPPITGAPGTATALPGPGAPGTATALPGPGAPGTALPGPGAPGTAALPGPATALPAPPPAADFLTPPVLTAKANGASYQQFIDEGWTDDQLIQNGYMAPR